MKFIKQNWGAIITILFMILVGVLLLVNPATFAIGIIKVAGVVLFLWGIYDLIRYFRTPADVAARGSAFFSGITMITLGAYCFFGSDWFVNVFPVLAVLKDFEEMGVLLSVLFLVAYVFCMMLYDWLLIYYVMLYGNRIRPKLKFLK